MTAPPLSCPNCGYENRLQAGFCGSCGRRLPGRAASPQAAAGPAQGAAAVGRTPSPAGYGAVHAALLYAGTAGVFAVAVYARVFGVERVPFGLHAGELAARAAALRVLDHDWIGPWSPAAGGQPTGFVYWLAGWAGIWPDDPTVLRLAAATLGLATVGAFYLFSRALFGGGPALAGSLLLALSQWHLLYSSLALPISSLPLPELASAGLLLYGLGGGHGEARRRGLLALAGVAFGLGLYSSNAFLLFAPALALVWGREFLSGEHPPGTVYARAVVFIIPAAVVALPYLVFLAAHGGPMIEEARGALFTRAPEYQALSGVAEQTRHVVGNVGRVAATLLWSRGGATDLAGSRLLDPLTAGLAVIGLAGAAWRLSDRRYLFLWLIVGCAVLGGAITTEAGLRERLVVALPAVFACAGLGMWWVVGLMRGRLSPAAISVVVAAAIAFVVWHNLSAHFGDRGL